MSWRAELIGGDPVEIFERYKILPEDLNVVEWDLDCAVVDIAEGGGEERNAVGYLD